MYTSHGHHIPGTDTIPRPVTRARCGGAVLCTQCAKETSAQMRKNHLALVTAIADELFRQYDAINLSPLMEARQRYTAQLRDDTIAVAKAIHRLYPEYDMDGFYHRAGYIGTHPLHT